MGRVDLQELPCGCEPEVVVSKVLSGVRGMKGVP